MGTVPFTDTPLKHRTKLVLKSSVVLDFMAGPNPLCCISQVHYVPIAHYHMGWVGHEDIDNKLGQISVIHAVAQHFQLMSLQYSCAIPTSSQAPLSVFTFYISNLYAMGHPRSDEPSLSGAGITT